VRMVTAAEGCRATLSRLPMRVPLQLNFVLCPSLVPGGLGVTRLRSKYYTQQA
jgi:hypothetical protein